MPNQQRQDTQGKKLTTNKQHSAAYAEQSNVQ